MKAPETKTPANPKAARYRGFYKQHAQYRGFSQPIKVAVVRKRLVGKQRVPMRTMKMRNDGARDGRDWAMVATPPAKRRRWSVGTPAKAACDGTREPLEPSSDRDAEFGPSGCHCVSKQRPIAVYRVETERRDRAPCTVFQAEFLQGVFLTGVEQRQLVQVSAL